MISSVQSSPPALVAVPPAPTSPGASPEARLLALMIKSQLVQGDSARTSVKLNEEQLKHLREVVREALEDAREAGEDSGFWGDIGDVLGGDIATLAEVVAVAAAALATGGAAAIVLGVIAVSCTLASKYSDELGIPPKVAIGIGIAAAVTSVLSGNVAAGGEVAATAGASQAAASAGGAVAHVSRFTQAMKQVNFVARLAAAGASGTGAVANGVSAYYHGEALNHDADAHAAHSAEKVTSMDIDAAVDLLSEAIDRQLAESNEASQALQSHQNGTQLILQHFQGIA